MPQNSPLRVGLALGGGGARGLAHIPVLEVFDELGIRPAVIAGCSMGALIGAAYACGMSGKDLRKHAATLLADRATFARHIFGTRKSKPLKLLSLKSLTSLHLDAETLVELALPDMLPPNIEDAMIPLKIIATDYDNLEEKVFAQGPLLPAVAASIAIPGIIAAPLIEGRLHVDGGVVNPVPFDKVRDNVDLVVAVDVTGRPRAVDHNRRNNLQVAIGSILIMFNRLAETKRALSPPDVYVQPAVEQIGVADFFRVREIFEASVPAQERLRRALTVEMENLPQIPGPV
ncbi:MAG: patatin-like phospholipase family protein [Proteobacteria bacterium]|nr:patatin-like phospholipase family protein [Pseudomonadota bacterium]